MKAKILKWFVNAPKWIIWAVKAGMWAFKNKNLAKTFIAEVKDSKKKIAGKIKEIKADDKITVEEAAELLNLIMIETPEVGKAFVKLILAK